MQDTTRMCEQGLKRGFPQGEIFELTAVFRQLNEESLQLKIDLMGCAVLLYYWEHLSHKSSHVVH